MSEAQVTSGPRKIVIDPVTRVEGHGKVTIRLNAEGEVEQARFHIVEFRGFERFIQGRMPPEPHGLVADVDPAFVQQVLHVAGI